jgi:hypothetical protein
MASEARLDDDLLPDIRLEFARQGYTGSLSVVDDHMDEAIFLVPVGTLATLAVDVICAALQGSLRRKVWVVEESEAWRAQARPL